MISQNHKPGTAGKYPTSSESLSKKSRKFEEYKIMIKSHARQCEQGPLRQHPLVRSQNKHKISGDNEGVENTTEEFEDDPLFNVTSAQGEKDTATKVDEYLYGGR